MTKLLPAFAIFALVYCSLLPAQTKGPESGSLLVVGGGMRDISILHRFAELAGGNDAFIVVIPTAGGADSYSENWDGLEQFRAAGLTNVHLLHTYDPKTADTEEFVQSIEAADGVWFTGGRQWRLADSYLNNRTHRALQDLLDRNGVIGGSSAGATILGSYLARGDTKTNTIMMGDHKVGFGFLNDVAIDQHMLKRNRQFDLIEIIEKHPQLLGIGIDEDTALVVQNNQFEVIGQGYVAIFDYEKMLDSGGLFYFLDVGDQFDLTSRQASRPRSQQPAFDRVIEKKWGQEN